jgi:hypothetical protein
MNYDINLCVQDLTPTPWKSIITSMPVWALVIAGAGHDWGAFTLISDLPKYMNDVLHFSVTEVSQKQKLYANELGTFVYIH